MKEITITELQIITGGTLTDLAEKIGCCVSLLSKVNHKREPITAELQRKFQKAFPNYILIGGKERWKEAYLEEVEAGKTKDIKIKELEEKVFAFEKKLKKISKIMSEV